MLSCVPNKQYLAQILPLNKVSGGNLQIVSVTLLKSGTIITILPFGFKNVFNLVY